MSLMHKGKSITTMKLLNIDFDVMLTSFPCII